MVWRSERRGIRGRRNRGRRRRVGYGFEGGQWRDKAGERRRGRSASRSCDTGCTAGCSPPPLPSRPQSAGAAETGLPVVLWEITLFKQMKCEHCLPYANRPRLISSLPVVQFKMSPRREAGWLGGWVVGGKDVKNVTEPQVLSVVWVACQ